MREYRNVSGTPEDLEGGRVIGVGECFTLDADAVKDAYNKAKIDEGKFIPVESTKEKSTTRKDGDS